MRRHLRAAFAFVGSDHGGRVDGQPFVRIHRHTEEPGVGLWEQDVTLTHCDAPPEAKMSSSATCSNSRLNLVI